MRAFAIGLACWLALAACGDPGFDMQFTNPCDEPVTFVFGFVEPGTTTQVGFPQEVTVGPRMTEIQSPLTIRVSSGEEVLVAVEGLLDYEERWPEPRANSSRTFTFDQSLCSLITES